MRRIDTFFSPFARIALGGPTGECASCGCPLPEIDGDGRTRIEASFRGEAVCVACATMAGKALRDAELTPPFSWERPQVVIHTQQDWVTT